VAGASRSRPERAGRVPTPQGAGRPRYKLLVLLYARSLAFNFYVAHPGLSASRPSRLPQRKVLCSATIRESFLRVWSHLGRPISSGGVSTAASTECASKEE
jgi:hypothetical protein